MGITCIIGGILVFAAFVGLYRGRHKEPRHEHFEPLGYVPLMIPPPRDFSW
ncbi:hypothetical protein KW801_00965 [Candidatus Saccharibacteria bacterium]|nr:hypothetical protein [Candidatus Saccharibacteria bacterium]